jgi:ParB family chromosome partitioning protein
VLSAYRDPFGKNSLVLAILPLTSVEPTPFQRDVSDMHHKRLADVIDKTGLFLDPIIAITAPEKGFWTPNGGHRLAAMRRLGAKSLTALVVPKRELAWQILALNTEKAHNLKDRSLEVIRMARALARREPRAKESDYAAQFEAAEFLTLGVLYAKDGRFAGGAYGSFLRKVDRFTDRTLAVSLREREGYAARLREIDTQVRKIVKSLEARGFKSPYLRTFVVARINPVRFHRTKPGDKKPPMPIAAALTRMTAAAKNFDIGKVRTSDLALVAALSSE